MLSGTGIRSLSKQDQFYLYKSNYWRGAVWINVNFLVLKGLFTHYLGVDGIQSQTEDFQSISYASKMDSSSELYETIRHSLIQSVYRNWRINHVFWEQYSDTTQLGLMTHPFNGWTSTILLIVAQKYGK